MLFPTAQHVFDSSIQYLNTRLIMSNMVVPTIQIKGLMLVCPWQSKHTHSSLCYWRYLSCCECSTLIVATHKALLGNTLSWFKSIERVEAELTNSKSVCKTNDTCSENYQNTVIITGCILGWTRPMWQLFQPGFSVLLFPIINKLHTPFHVEWKVLISTAVIYSIHGRNIQY